MNKKRQFEEIKEDEDKPMALSSKIPIPQPIPVPKTSPTKESSTESQEISQKDEENPRKKRRLEKKAAKKQKVLATVTAEDQFQIQSQNNIKRIQESVQNLPGFAESSTETSKTSQEVCSLRAMSNLILSSCLPPLRHEAPNWYSFRDNFEKENIEHCYVVTIPCIGSQVFESYKKTLLDIVPFFKKPENKEENKNSVAWYHVVAPFNLSADADEIFCLNPKKEEKNEQNKQNLSKNKEDFVTHWTKQTIWKLFTDMEGGLIPKNKKHMRIAMNYKKELENHEEDLAKFKETENKNELSVKYADLEKFPKLTDEDLKIVKENYVLCAEELEVNKFPGSNYFISLKKGDSKSAEITKKDLISQGFCFSSQHSGQDVQRLVALDCEMCKVDQESVLSRISVVNHKRETLLDELVKPPVGKTITDYLTQYSGITKEKLENVTTTLEDIQKRILEFVSEDTIIVGHSLEFDFRALKIVHKTVCDTSLIWYPPQKQKKQFSTKIEEKTEISTKIEEKIDDSTKAEEKTEISTKKEENSTKIDEKTEISTKEEEKTENSTKKEEKTEIPTKKEEKKDDNKATFEEKLQNYHNLQPPTSKRQMIQFPNQKQGLKRLSEMILGRQIQKRFHASNTKEADVLGHDSVEDAVCALDLVKARFLDDCFLKFAVSFGIISKSQAKAANLPPLPPKKPSIKYRKKTVFDIISSFAHGDMSKITENCGLFSNSNELSVFKKCAKIGFLKNFDNFQDPNQKFPKTDEEKLKILEKNSKITKNLRLCSIILHDFDNFAKSFYNIDNNKNTSKRDGVERQNMLKLGYNLKKFVEDLVPAKSLVVVLFPFGNLRQLFALHESKEQWGDQKAFVREFENLARNACLGMCLTGIKK